MENKYLKSRILHGWPISYDINIKDLHTRIANLEDMIKRVTTYAADDTHKMKMIAILKSNIVTDKEILASLIAEKEANAALFSAAKTGSSPETEANIIQKAADEIMKASIDAARQFDAIVDTLVKSSVYGEASKEEVSQTLTTATNQSHMALSDQGIWRQKGAPTKLFGVEMPEFNPNEAMRTISRVISGNAPTLGENSNTAKNVKPAKEEQAEGPQP